MKLRDNIYRTARVYHCMDMTRDLLQFNNAECSNSAVYLIRNDPMLIKGLVTTAIGSFSR